MHLRLKKGRIEERLRKEGLKGFALHSAIEREFQKVKDRIVEAFVSEARDPDLRKIKLEIGLGEISYRNPLREKWERELDELEGKR